MNVLILSLKHSISKGGGAGKVVQDLGERWVARGINVRVLTIKTRDLPEYESIDGVEVIRKGNLYTAILSFMKEYLKKHRNWAEIVIENMTSYPLFTPIYLTPKFIIVHIVEGKEYFKMQSILKALIGYFSQKLIPIIYKKAKFVSVSNSTQKSLIDLGIPKSSIDVVSIGVDVKVFHPGTKNPFPTLIYLGRLNRGKNVKDVIESFRYVVSENPKAQLFIVGKGEEFEKLKKQSRDIRNIRFLGFVKEKKKIKLLQSSWIFISTPIKEGKPLTYLEANACGLPVVCYGVQGTEYIRNGINGIRVHENTPQTIAKTCLHLIENAAERKKLEQKCIKYVSRYSWEKQIDQFLMRLKDK